MHSVVARCLYSQAQSNTKTLHSCMPLVNDSCCNVFMEKCTMSEGSTLVIAAWTFANTFNAGKLQRRTHNEALTEKKVLNTNNRCSYKKSCHASTNNRLNDIFAKDCRLGMWAICKRRKDCALDKTATNMGKSAILFKNILQGRWHAYKHQDE